MDVSASAAVDLFQATGIPLEVTTFSDARIAERHARFVVRQRPPSPASIEQDPSRVLVYVVPHITEHLRHLAMSTADVSVVGIREGQVIWDRRLHHSRPEETPARPGRRRRPWARLALIRALARTARPRTQAELAAEIGATQAAVSQSLKRLEAITRRTAEGWALTDVEAAAEKFLAEYPGPGGISISWYGVSPVMSQVEVAARKGQDVLASGDAGADRIAPWRSPRTAVLYATTGIDLKLEGFAESNAEKGTLTVTVPADPTVHPVARAYAAAGLLPPQTADPFICAYDVSRSGGSDAGEAAHHLVRTWAQRWASHD